MGNSATVVDLNREPRGGRGAIHIAYLDPPYSRYFQGLSQRLARRTGGEVLALLSSPAYAMYTGGDRHLVWPPGALADAPALPADAAHALWSQQAGDAHFRAVFWHAVAWLREKFRAHGIRLCLVFSDARPFSLAAAVAARDCGVRCLYVERGALRMRTASLSAQGLNARFSLDAARLLQGIEGLREDAPLGARPQEPWLKPRFARFLAANEWACRVAPDRRLLQHKRYDPLSYARLWLSQRWASFKLARRSDAEPRIDEDAPAVLLPLQLPADSQFRLHSPFADNQAFIDFVVQQARLMAPQVPVLVKRHPMDGAHYRLPPGARWVGGNLSRLYGPGLLVVCINSTVGFEAAARGVPVICFGPSFYTASAAIALAQRGNFAQLLAERIGAPLDVAEGRALLADVLRWYQSPGDTWGYTDADLEATADIALQHFRAAEAPHQQPQWLLQMPPRAVPTAAEAPAPVRQPAAVASRQASQV